MYRLLTREVTITITEDDDNFTFKIVMEGDGNAVTFNLQADAVSDMCDHLQESLSYIEWGEIESDEF